MLRIMLADDEQYERDYLEKVVKESYPTLLKIVYKAADGVEFLENLEECDPQIILLDVKMPRMDGLETAKKIREKYPDVEVIIVSAYNDFAYAKQAMKLGISEYLLKPYLDGELREVLDRVIARIREREDTLAMLSYSARQGEWSSFDIFKDSEKDYLWNLIFRRKTLEETEQSFSIHEADGWLKVVVISSSALSRMGNFSQEVLENYFRMDGVTVWDSIWMNQMIICLFSARKEVFTEVNGCIRRARNYLAEEHQIPVACGVSGTYDGLSQLPGAYEEAASFIREFSEPEVSRGFSDTSERMRRICELEDAIILSLSEGEKESSLNLFLELLEVLETGLEYQDVAVKLNFARSFLTILHGINRMPGLSIREDEVIAHMETLEGLNFNGAPLRDYIEFFSDMAVEKESLC